MELLQLRYFCALAESEHLTKTAEQLMISPPSLSATISKLEQSLGVTLFDRKGRNIRLNRFGSVFYSRVKPMLEALDNAEKEVRYLSEGQEHKVRVGISSLPIWETVLTEFQNTHPTIAIDYFNMSPFSLDNSRITKDMDFYLGVSRDIPSERYDAVNVHPPEYPVAVLSKNHRLAQEKYISLDQCREETFLSLGANQPSAHKYILDLCHAAGFSPKKIIEVDYFFRLKMLQDNRGIVLTTDLGAKYIYANPGSICVIPISDPVIVRTQMIAWKKETELSKAAVIFRDYLCDYYK